VSPERPTSLLVARISRLAPRWPYRIALILAPIALIALVVAVAEVVFRAVHPETRDERMSREFRTRSLQMLAPCLRFTGGSRSEFVASRDPHLATSTDTTFRLLPAPGVLRIAVVGESSAELLGLALDNTARAARRSRVEVVNCGLGGASLEHAMLRATEVLGGRPHVVLVVFGHNINFRYEMDARMLRRARLRDHSRLLTWLARPTAANRTEVDWRPRLRMFETQLRAFAATARSRGIRVVAATLAGNHDIPPRIDTPAGIRAVWLARQLAARGNPAGAAALLEQLPSLDQDAVASYWLGRFLETTGRVRDAARRLRRAVDLDQPVMRAPEALAETLRRMGHDGVLDVFDLEALVQARCGRPAPGWESISDIVHLRPGLAAELLPALWTALAPGRGLESVPQRSWTTERGVTSAFDEVRGELASGFIGMPWEDSLPLLVRQREREAPGTVHAPLLELAHEACSRPPTREIAPALLGIAGALWELADHREALAVNAHVSRVAPGPAHKQRALMLLGVGDEAGAAREIELARRADPMDRSFADVGPTDAGGSHAESVHVIRPGRERELTAMVAPVALGSSAAPGWTLDAIRIQRDRVLYVVRSSDGSLAHLAVMHPDDAPAGSQRTASFAVVPNDASGNGREALQRLADLLHTNDRGTFWR